MYAYANELIIYIMYVSVCSCRCISVCFSISRSIKNRHHMRIQVPVRILNRDHRADSITESSPVRLHVRTDSIFVSVAIPVSGTSLSVSVAVSVSVSVSVQLKEICTEYDNSHKKRCTSLSVSVAASVSVSVSIQLRRTLVGNQQNWVRELLCILS